MDTTLLLIELFLSGTLFVSFVKYFIEEKEKKFQHIYFLLGLLCCFVRILLIYFYEQDFLIHGTNSVFLAPPWRIITILLSYYSAVYFVIYFSRFRFIRAVKTGDKIFTLISHTILYVVPIIFLTFLYFGNSNSHNYDYTNIHSILPLTHQLPEATLANFSMGFIFVLILVLAIIPVKTIFVQKISIRISYIFLIASIFLKSLFSFFSIFDLEFSRVSLSFVLIGLFASFFFVGRSLRNESLRIS
jgi:hypothetical protein